MQKAENMRKKAAYLIVTIIAAMLLCACRQTAISDEFDGLNTVCADLGFHTGQVEKDPKEGTLYECMIFKGLSQEATEDAWPEGYGYMIWTQYEDEKAAQKAFEDWMKWYTKNGNDFAKSDDSFVCTTSGKTYSSFSVKGNLSLQIVENSSAYYDEYAEFVEAAGYTLPDGVSVSYDEEKKEETEK